MKKKFSTSRYIIIMFIFLFGGWGKVGHQKINYNITKYLPSEMKSFSIWQPYLSDHASDPDNRKNDIPDEGIKHYLDIDNYPEFTSKGFIQQNIDSLINTYGKDFVYKQGIVPWAVLATYDSVKSCFIRKDWNRAAFFANDLGHYVGDCYMPFHITKNYNPGGLHQRAESILIEKYANEICFTSDTISFITDIKTYVFNCIYKNYTYIDSFLVADSYAKTFTSDTKSDLYYSKLWFRTNKHVNYLFTEASKSIASMIYTAWIQAGKPVMDSTSGIKEGALQNKIKLFPNHKSHYNPQTKSIK